MVERPAVNRNVAGSSPSPSAKHCRLPKGNRRNVGQSRPACNRTMLRREGGSMADRTARTFEVEPCPNG